MLLSTTTRFDDQDDYYYTTLYYADPETGELLAMSVTDYMADGAGRRDGDGHDTLQLELR